MDVTLDNHEQWSGCCSKSDKHFVKFVTQVGFGASLAIFAMVQIARSDVESKEIYFSLLSGIVGTFLPHPTLKEKQ
jgi:hypothetical protein